MPETLRHLSLQKTAQSLSWEIILVDNASTDDTKAVAKNEWTEQDKSSVPLKIIDQPIQGLSFARAKGIEASAYDILIFCDDDNWLESNYIQDAYSLVNSDLRIGALGGTGIAVSDSVLPNWFDKYKYSFACYAQGECDGELTNPKATLYGAGLVVRREVLIELNKKKFKPLLTDRIKTKLVSGGDTELCYAIRLIGYKLSFSERLKFFHYLPEDRLTENYLQRLNKSLAYCSASLIIYRYVLLGKEVTRLLWWKDISYQLIMLCNSFVRLLTRANPAFEKRLDFDFSINTLKGIVHQFGTYRSRYNQLLKLKLDGKDIL